MFDILFGWPKASKCKKAIKRTRCRLRLLKNKRQTIVRQLREDLAELIRNGHEEAAVNRVEQLIVDESLVAAYELLDHFCEFILTQLKYIRKHKDCPNDINEAVSSLIFASARCGDLPELFVIRKLFGERYGEKFATTAVELFPGNLVNIQLKEKLSVKSVPNDLKYRMVDEIARDDCLQTKVLAIEYYPDWQQFQVKENKGYHVVESHAQENDTIAGSNVHPSEVEEIESQVISVNSSISNPSGSCSVPEYTSAMVSTVQQYPPYSPSYPLQKKMEKVEDFPELTSFATPGLQNEGERMALTYPAERVSCPPFSEESDVDQFSISKDGSYRDQRLLKFRSSELSRREKIQSGCDESDMDQDEFLSEKSSKRCSRKCKRAPKKRPRKRSASLEIQGMMDIGYMIYYHKPCRNPSAHKHDTHYCMKQKMPLLEGIPQSSYAQKRMKQHSSSEKEKNLQTSESEDGTKGKSFNFKMRGCSLDHPCYFCVYNDKDCLDALSMKPKGGVRATHIQQVVYLADLCFCRFLWYDEEINKGRELITVPQSGEQDNEIKAETSESLGSYASSTVSNPRTTDSLTRTEMAAPYSRALTMPPERPKNCEAKLLSTYSLPSQRPKHVHPKLPDYEDIAAKFTAIKREYLKNKDRCRD